MNWPFFRRPDYHQGSVTYTREALFLRLSGEVKYTDPSIPSVALFHDKDFSVLRHDLAVQFKDKALRDYPQWASEVLDCDDLEGLFRADRIRYRRKARLRTPEAMGGVDYIRKDGLCHRAAWMLTDKGLFIVEPATGEVKKASDEVAEVVYFDA